MKITYNFVTGETVEVEVNEELGAEIIAIEHHASLRDRAESRRHESIDVLNDMGHQLSDPASDFITEMEELETEAEKQAAIIKLRQAMMTLLPQQRDLIQRLIFDGQALTEISHDLGISKQACYNRLQKIYRQLQKIL